jgi:hypothetical protein
MIVNVTMSIEGNYQDYGTCMFHIEADVSLVKVRYGSDADGSRGIDTFEDELRDAVVYIDVFNDEGVCVKTIKQNADALTADMVEKIFDKALGSAVV